MSHSETTNQITRNKLLTVLNKACTTTYGDAIFSHLFSTGVPLEDAMHWVEKRLLHMQAGKND